MVLLMLEKYRFSLELVLIPQFYYCSTLCLLWFATTLYCVEINRLKSVRKEGNGGSKFVRF